MLLFSVLKSVTFFGAMVRCFYILSLLLYYNRIPTGWFRMFVHDQHICVGVFVFVRTLYNLVCLSACLSVCVHHNLSTSSLIISAFGILLKDPSGKKPIENGLGPVKIVEMGGILVFFLYVLSVLSLNLLFWVGGYVPKYT